MQASEKKVLNEWIIKCFSLTRFKPEIMYIPAVCKPKCEKDSGKNCRFLRQRLFGSSSWLETKKTGSKLHVFWKRQWTYFEALKLWKARSGTQHYSEKKHEIKNEGKDFSWDERVLMAKVFCTYMEWSVLPGFFLKNSIEIWRLRLHRIGAKRSS